MPLKEILREAGIILSSEDNAIHCLSNEQVLVRRKLSKLLTPQNLSTFTRELESYMGNEEHFAGCVQICNSSRRAMRTTSKQNTLVHIFIMIPPLQKIVAQIVVEKLAHAIASEDVGLILSILTSLHNVTLPEEITSYLARNLLENIDVADRPLQLTLLEHLPKIVKGAQRRVVADHLITLMEDNETLTKVIMNSLMELDLTQEHIRTVTEFIVARLLDSQRHYENFALLFQFLVVHNDDKASVFRQTRDTMDKVMKQATMIDVKRDFHAILMRFTATDFHLVLQRYPKADPKMIDFYLYLMMFAAEFDHKFGMNIIRRRIRSQELSNDLITKCIEVMLVGNIFADLFKSSIEFAFELIKGDNQQECVKVGALIFQLLFTHSECDAVMQNRIIYTLNYILKIAGPNCHEVLLSMLRNLSSDNKLSAHSTNLMSFLELYPMLSLPHWHVLLEIICANVASNEEHLDDLRQYLQKFPISSYRKHGIMAGVMLAMHLPTTDEVSESQKSSMESHTSRVNINAAKALLEFTMDRCINAECFGLYYDELDSALNPRTHADILQWLNDDIVNNFSEKYVTSEIPEQVALPVKAQYELNTDDEVDVRYLVNIGGFVQNPKEHTSIVVLASLFRLLRHINCLQNEGDMDAVDALLGCGVLLPDLDDLESYNDAELKIAADCVFYCVNWFRELVSGFVKQRANPLRIKVIKRIRHIVELQDKLNKCRSLFTSENYYNLPPSYFYEGHKRKYEDDEQESAKKRARKNSTVSSVKVTPKSVAKTHPILHSEFRKMDTDVLILLKYPVTSPNTTASQLKNLESKQFQFILRDSIEKLADAMRLDDRLAFYGQSVDLKEYLEDCETFLPFVHRHFRHVAEEIANLLKDHDYDDFELIRKHANDLKCSFDLVMEFYKLIFSWKGFQKEEHRELLRNSLKYFNHAEQASLDTSFRCSMTMRSYNLLGREFIVNMSKYRTHCLLISSAASMLQLMENVIALLEHNIEACGKVVVEVATAFLKRRWLTEEGHADVDQRACAALKIVVDAFLRNANAKSINGIVGKVQEEVEKLESKRDSLQTFAAIDRSNLHILYRGLFQRLTSCLSIDAVNSKGDAEHLVTWRYAALALQGLMAIAKRPGNTRNLKIFVTASVRIINLFIAHGISALNKMLKTNAQMVDEISMLVQNCTKFLHQLCCQAAKHKIAGFDSLVPIVRTTIETLIIRVKKMLVENQCNDAMWAGILKNKDVHGEELLSQMTDSTTCEDEDVDEDVDVPTDDLLNEVEELHSESSVYPSTSQHSMD